jgi:hypothetical protein
VIGNFFTLPFSRRTLFCGVWHRSYFQHFPLFASIHSSNKPPWNRVLFDQLRVVQFVKEFLPFMEPKSSLPCSLEPSYCLRHMNLVHNFLSCFFQIHFNTILPSMPGFSKWCFPQVQTFFSAPCLEVPCHCASHIVRDQVSHPYKRTDKIIVLYVVVC